MESSAPVQLWEQPSRRHSPRYRLKAPVDVTVLRSGIPDTLPGRAVNVGERGLAVVLAGELAPGESVAVQLQLRAGSMPLRTRASVRHHNKLRCGVEFIGLSPEQQSAVRQWADEVQAETESCSDTKTPEGTLENSENGESGDVSLNQTSRLRRKLHAGFWILVALAVAVFAGALWWNWNHSWRSLEANLPTAEREEIHPEARVPADVMQQLIIHRVEPEYPEEARAEKLTGVILLDVTVGRDGTVIATQALNGPPVLARAAMAAIRWWRFEPYRLQGRPAVVATTLAIEFKQ